METERHVNEEHEDEGIPDHAGPLPAKRATGDQQEGIMLPGEDPAGADQHGTTAAEHRRGEALGDRLAEERPKRPPPREPREEAGQLTEDDRFADRPDRAAAVDTEAEVVATEGEPFALPPEEEAVGVEEEDDAPGVTSDESDGYVEEP